MDLLFDLLVKFVKGIWRAVKVKRTAPDENHTATEYADAFLFPEDPVASNSPDPPTMLDRRH
jgi:hypothetical protein